VTLDHVTVDIGTMWSGPPVGIPPLISPAVSLASVRASPVLASSLFELATLLVCDSDCALAHVTDQIASVTGFRHRGGFRSQRRACDYFHSR
jgi:hypothetical protein